MAMAVVGTQMEMDGNLPVMAIMGVVFRKEVVFRVVVILMVEEVETCGGWRWECGAFVCQGGGRGRVGGARAAGYSRLRGGHL